MNYQGILAAVSLALGVAFPVWAEVNVPALTCGEYSMMDSAGQATVADALVRWVQSSANSGECGTLPAQLGCGTGDVLENREVRALIARRCTGASASANMVEEMRKSDL